MKEVASLAFFTSPEVVWDAVRVASPSGPVEIGQCDRACKAVGGWVCVDVLGQVLDCQVTSSDRFVAKASRVLPTPPGLSAGTASSAWFPWWTLGVGAGVVVAVTWAGLTRRRPDDGSPHPRGSRC